MSVEIVIDEAGAESLAEHVALAAIDYDSAFKGNAIVLSNGAESAPSRHVIEGPLA